MNSLFLFLILFFAILEFIPAIFSFINQKYKKKESGQPLSVVIPIKNEEKIIKRVIEEWERLNYEPGIELIIVDQSTDETSYIIEALMNKYEDIIHIYLDPKKYNKFTSEIEGLKNANNKLVLINDADKIPTTDILLGLTDYFTDEKVGAIFQKTIPVKESNLMELFTGMELMNKYIDQKFASLLDSVPYLSLSSCVVRRELLLGMIGDRDIISDDIFFALEIKKRGFRSIYVNDNYEKEAVVSSFSDLIKRRLRASFGTYQAAVINYEGLAFNSKYGLFGTIILPLRQIGFILGSLLTPVLFFSIVMMLSDPIAYIRVFIAGYIIILVPFITRAFSINMILKYKQPRYYIVAFFYPFYYFIAYRMFSSFTFFRSLLGKRTRWEKTETDRG